MHARILVSLVLFALWGLSAKAQFTSDPLDKASVEQFIQANPDTKLKFIAAEKGGMVCKDLNVMARYKKFMSSVPPSTDPVVDPGVSNGAAAMSVGPRPTKPNRTKDETRKAELQRLIRKDPDNAAAYRRELKEMEALNTSDR